MAAITLGMGTDAAYVEPADAALQWHGPSPKLGEMVSAITAMTLLHSTDENKKSLMQNSKFCITKFVFSHPK